MSRQRWAYTMGGKPLPEPVLVDADYHCGGERQPVFTDRHMEGDRAPDGSDISSRAKRKAWMRATGSADLSDYTGTLARAQQQREAWRTGRAEVSGDMIQEVGRAAQQARGKGRR